jgi:hypothetical protein
MGKNKNKNKKARVESPELTDSDSENKEPELEELWKSLSEEDRQFKVFCFVHKLKDAIIENENKIFKLIQRVTELENENESLRRETIKTTVRITGVTEKKDSTYITREKLVERLFRDMGLTELKIRDCKEIKFVGKKHEGASRPLLINFSRLKDKIQFLMAKKTLIGKKAYANIYINPEKTRKQFTEERTLRNTAKQWKMANPGLEYSIKFGTLKVQLDGKTTNHKVDEEGLVTEISNL